MVQLRTMTYPSCGDPVMVRLRASVVPSPSNVVPVDMYHPYYPTGIMIGSLALPKKKRKKKKRPKRKKNKPSSTSVSTTASTVTSTSIPGSTDHIPSPLVLSQDQFPSLLRQNDDVDKVEWMTTSVEGVNDDSIDNADDDDDDDDESEESLSTTKVECFEEGEETKLSSKIGGQHSDTASTATTTSSNASSGFDSSQTIPNLCNSMKSTTVLGGYAAALRRMPFPISTGTMNEGILPSSKGGAVSTTAKVVNASTDIATEPSAQQASSPTSTIVRQCDDLISKSPSMVVDPTPVGIRAAKVGPDPLIITSPPMWGSSNGRLFVDVLRNKEKQ
jgi:hypothetical protein